MDGVILTGPDAGIVGQGYLSLLPTPPQVNDSVFAIDVVQSDATSGIAVATVPDIKLPLNQRPMEPFTGATTLRVLTPTAISGVNPPLTVTGPADGGSIVLGALTVNPQGAQNLDNYAIMHGTPLIPDSAQTATAGQFQFVPAGLVTPGLTINSNAFGSFRFGGTITGSVTIHGSISQFYAGWIVTGLSYGETDVSIITVPHNFQVDGDIDDLLTVGAIGTDPGDADLPVGRPIFATGFDMNVNGRIGQIHAAGPILGSVNATNNNPAVGFPVGTPEQEEEFRGNATTQVIGGQGYPLDPWDQGLLGGNAFFNNDTFATPQYLGADSSGNITVDGQLQVSPTNGDDVDYYAVALLAGQTITVQVTEPTGTVPSLDTGVFDPDGRLIASDFNRVDPTQTEEQPFQFTATEPGIYRFAVGESVNPNFDAVPANIVGGTFPYVLSIKNVGSLGIGGLVSDGILMDNPNTTGTTTANGNIDAFHVVNGDFGAVVGGTSVISQFGDAESSIYSIAADNGNLRAVVGGQVGAPNQANSATYLSPSVFVPNGSVGLVEATSGALAWNVFLTGVGTQLTQAESTALSIGGDYQWINAPAGSFIGDLVAKGNIGTIQCANMATTTDQGYFQVNAAFNPALHGTIDLIDSGGDIGTNGTGGPAITTGPGGNVRYIHIPDTAEAFRDEFFGGGAPNETLYQPGEAATITDDSGTVVSLTPVGGTNPTVTTTGTGTGTTGSTPGSGVTVTYATPASLTVLTYPIRGSGGAAIVRVRSDDSVNIAASGAGGVQSAEIGSIVLGGTGTQVTNNNTQFGNGGTAPTAGGTTTTISRGAAAGTPGGAPVKTTGGNLPYVLPTVPPIPSLAVQVPLTLNISGSVKIDTFDVHGVETATGTLATNNTFITSLTDTTGGEIVNLNATSVGTLTTNGVLGMAVETNTPASVQGLIHTPVGSYSEPWGYPFLMPTSMVRIQDDVVSINAAQVGNVYAGQVLAPATTPGGTPDIGGGAITGGTNGNIGSISGRIIGPIVAAGSIGNANAAGGFAPHGSGAVGGAGLYAVGIIGPVVSSGDMRGEIVSTHGTLSITVTNNGSIAEASIGTLTEFDYAEARAISVLIPAVSTPITKPQLDIGGITVQGNGGIIGSEIVGDHIGPIAVANTGFGMFDSLINLRGDGTIASITVGGYGVRDGTFNVGARLGSLVVNGNGGDLPVTNFSAAVRQSETGAQFTSSGTPISFLNDINAFLGTNASTPSAVGVTDSGVIEDLTVTGSRDLTTVRAYSIRGRDLTTLASVVSGFTPALTPNVTSFNVANSIGTITVTGPINGFAITTGRSTKYQFGGDVSNFNLTIAGPMMNLVMKSSLGGTSSINAIGPSGHIGTLTISGNLAGTVSAQTYINNLHVLGTITGTVNAARIGIIHVSGGIGSGGVTINGPLNQLIVDTSFGPAGNPIQVNGNANIINIKGDLAANINVTGNLKQLIVGGSIISGSTTTIGGILNLLKVAADVQAGATVQAQLIKRQMIKGQVFGTITTS
jgi:hypothetical protein